MSSVSCVVTSRWRGMNRELKLTCKMSGFRSQKVARRAQIVCALKVGTSYEPRAYVWGGSGGGRIGSYYNAPVSLLTVGGVEDIMTQSTAEENCKMDFFESHLPDLVSTMMPLAQHLKEASTAPMATVSVGSRVR